MRSNLILAYGRDPYFASWPDTLQLDYSNPAPHRRRTMTRNLTQARASCRRMLRSSVAKLPRSSHQNGLEENGRRHGAKERQSQKPAHA